SVVVWTTDHPNSSRHDIHAQRFFPNGTKNGEEFVVSNPDVFASDSRHPRVAMNSSGEFAVVWEDHGVSPSPGSQDFFFVEGKYYDSAGKPTSGLQFDIDGGGVFDVSRRPAHAPDVAMDIFGNVVVSYTRDASSTDRNVRARAFDRNFLHRLSDI